MPRGRTLGIVGEFGLGQVDARPHDGRIAAPRPRASIDLDGRDVAELLAEDRRALYRRVQMVFQDPLGSLNPRKTVRQILEAPLKALRGMDAPSRARARHAS